MFVEKNLEVVAGLLGISVEELEQLQYDEGEDTSEDGLLNGYYLTFPDNNPEEVIAKIRGLQGRTVYFPPDAVEDKERALFGRVPA